MTENTRYPYSINFSLASILLMLVLLYLLFNNVYRLENAVIWVFFGLFCAAFVMLATVLVIKRVIPALKGLPALELTEGYLIDYTRNITVNWKDISGIKLVRGRSSAIMRIELKWESDYGGHIAIPLRWIKGKDEDIYDTVMAYFESGRMNERHEELSAELITDKTKIIYGSSQNRQPLQ